MMPTVERSGRPPLPTPCRTARGIIARCACNHEALIPIETLRPDEFVPDIALRLRCTACGDKRIETYPDWSGGWRSGNAPRPDVMRPMR